MAGHFDRVGLDRRSSAVKILLFLRDLVIHAVLPRHVFSEASEVLIEASGLEENHNLVDNDLTNAKSALHLSHADHHGTADLWFKFCDYQDYSRFPISLASHKYLLELLRYVFQQLKCIPDAYAKFEQATTLPSLIKA